MALKDNLREWLQRFGQVMISKQTQGIRADLTEVKLQQRNILAKHILHPLQPKSFLPESQWSMESHIILAAVNDIRTNSRHQIVEFGSGVSTFYIGKLLQQVGGTLYSFEGNADWYELYREILVAEGLDDTVILSHAPLKACSESLRSGTDWYDMEVVLDVTSDVQIDMIIVDGPERGLGYATRYPAVSVMSNRLADSYAILLDDSQSADEKATLVAWEKHLDIEFTRSAKFAMAVKGGVPPSW